MIYILQLEHNKFYVGYTSRKNCERFNEHFNGCGSEWTKKYKPINVLEYHEGNKQDEDRITLQLMKKLGWWNVRGGQWCKVKMSHPPDQLNGISNFSLTRERSLQKECNRCGRTSHTINQCYASTDINGYQLVEACNDDEDYCII